MENPTHFPPPEQDVEAYAGGKDRVIYGQCIAVAEAHPTHVAKYLEDTARAVARRFCSHGDEPPRVLDRNTTKTRLESLKRGHSGLCGVHQADVITAVDPDVVRQIQHEEAPQPGEVFCSVDGSVPMYERTCPHLCSLVKLSRVMGVVVAFRLFLVIFPEG